MKKGAKLIVGRVIYWLGLPFVIFLLNKTTRTRIVVICNREVLLVQPWLSGGLWDLPGGGMHKNEIAEKAATRELLEETGIRARVDQLKFVRSMEMKSRFVNFEALLYKLELKNKPEIKLQAMELTDARWFSLDEISKLPTVTGVQVVVESLDI